MQVSATCQLKLSKLRLHLPKQMYSAQHDQRISTNTILLIVIAHFIVKTFETESVYR